MVDIIGLDVKMRKKPKVAIVTIISRNYGNRLQNYALQVILQKLNIQVETIPIERKYDFKGKFKLGIKAIVAPFIKKYSNVCWDLFDQNICWSKYTTEDDIVGTQYDYFVAGSDQIWNPIFECNSDREFLVFATDEKKIAYAASIGLDELPNDEIERYRRYISGFKAVSVREKSAADIIENLGCARPKVVLDPTMLLSGEDWKMVINQSKIRIKRRYVVAYFLGMRTPEYDSYITQKTVEMNAELIDIMKLSSDVKNRVGPAEFVSLLYHSEAVFTDSFHGTVFSILFCKPFIVFERPYEEGYGKMSSRLDTLLETFGLHEHRVNSERQMKIVKPEYNCSKVNEILKEKRKDSMKYLEGALHIKKQEDK